MSRLNYHLKRQQHATVCIRDLDKPSKVAQAKKKIGPKCLHQNHLAIFAKVDSKSLIHLVFLLIQLTMNLFTIQPFK